MLQITKNTEILKVILSILNSLLQQVAGGLHVHWTKYFYLHLFMNSVTTMSMLTCTFQAARHVK